MANHALRNPKRWMLVARLCCSAVFFYSAFIKGMFFDGAVAEFTTLSLPLPALTVGATILFQALGALFLIAGFQLILTCVALSAFVLFASLVGHPFWQFEGLEHQRQLTTFLEHIAIIGGLIALSLHEYADNTLTQRPSF